MAYVLLSTFAQLLSQLVGSSGLEPPTSRLSGARSNRLSYEPILDPGSHLLSRAVSSQVSSAACVLTVVFGMGTGVSHRRITTGNPLGSLIIPENQTADVLNQISIERR